jgi:hypothetical protein
MSARSLAAYPRRRVCCGGWQIPGTDLLSAITKRGNIPLGAFLQGLKELGHVDGQTVDIAYSFAEGHFC